jgi:hypothetical protein
MGSTQVIAECKRRLIGIILAAVNRVRPWNAYTVPLFGARSRGKPVP